MKITRKLLSVILALIMMVNAFAICSFAVGPDFANGDTLVHYTIETDKPSYEKGDIVTFTVKIQTLAEVGTINNTSQICYGYDSSVLELLSTTATTLADHGFVCGSAFESGYVASLSKVDHHETMAGNNGCSIEAGNNWDKMFGIVVGCNNCMVDASAEPVVMYSFQMRVKADTTATSTVFGVNHNVYDEWWGFQNNERGDLYTQDASSAGYSATYIYDGDPVELTIGTPAAPSILTYGGAQIRFDDVGNDGNYGQHKDGKFDVRTIAKITTENFNATFGSEQAAKDGAIAEFGFVYAAKSNVPGLAIEDFKTKAEAIAKGEATDANYEKVSLEYIQRTTNGYLFTCLIEDIQDTAKSDGVYCLAFVKNGATGEYIFFDAAAEADYTTLHTYVPGFTA